jgi:hypothetical protein
MGDCLVMKKISSLLLIGLVWFSLSDNAVAQPTTIVAAQIADGAVFGGTYRTVLFIVNPNSAAIRVNVEFFDSSGSALSLETSDGTRAAFEVTVAGGSQSVVRTTGTRSTGTGGFARLRSADRFSVFVVLQFYNSSGGFVAEATVVPNNLARRFFVPVEQTSDGFESALALANSSETETAVLTLRIRNAAGTTTGTTTLSLAPRQHVARFAREFFPAVLTAGFVGAIEVETPVAVAATGLRTFTGNISGTGQQVTIITSTIPIVIEESIAQ